MVYRLKKYSICCSLLASAFLCSDSIAADRQVAIPNAMKIRLYYTDEAILSQNASAIIPMPITTETTFSDLQVRMRQGLRRLEGSLMNGSFKIDELTAKTTISAYFRKRNARTQGTFEDFAQCFSFFAFDFVFHPKD